jgi:preprotein translocase subunit SecE
MSEKKKSASQSETVEEKAPASEKALKSEKTAKAVARDARPSKQPVRRETRPASPTSKKSGGFKNWRVVRFVRESYHELRYKVTWPTFIEARNMTFVVIGLSLVVGLILGLVDNGLFQLFKLITGK